MKKKLFTAVVLLIAATTSAQYNYRDSNRIGITVGMNQTTLSTNNFDTTPEMGWNAGLSVRGNFYNDFDMVYAMQFSENNFSVATMNEVLAEEDVKYKIASAQISLMLSYKIIENHLSIEAGPLLQVNGKMKIKENQESNIISGTTLLASDIVDVNKFNFHGVVGITAGVKHLRANIQYQYGFSNFLNNLNDNEFGTNFKGKLGILSGNIIVYF